MFQLDYRSGVSICDQIVNNIIRLKTLGVLKGGSVMPSVRALASQLAINPNTVAKAYTLLEASGIICSVRGKGTFICEDLTADNAIKENAKSEFIKSVKSALDFGLGKKELIDLINETEETK